MNSQTKPLDKAEKLKLAQALAKMPVAKRRRLVELEAKRRKVMLP